MRAPTKEWLIDFCFVWIFVAIGAFYGFVYGNSYGHEKGYIQGRDHGHEEGYSQGFADGRELGMAEVQTPEYTRATCTEWWHGSKREAKKMVDKYCEVTK